MSTHWRHFAYRTPQLTSRLIAAPHPVAVQRENGVKVSCFQENDVLAVAAQAVLERRRRERSFWIVKLRADGDTAILSVDKPVAVLFSVRGVLRRKILFQRAVEVTHLLAHQKIDLATLNFSLFRDCLEMNLTTTEIKRKLAP